MSTRRTINQLPVLSRRLRRWQDVEGHTNRQAADALGIALRTYTNALLGEHLPLGIGRTWLEKMLSDFESKNLLPPIE